jgi:D-alanine-D-alanine ligase
MSPGGEQPRVAVLYNAPTLLPEHPDAVSEADVVAVARAVVSTLNAGGFDAHLTPAAPPVGELIRSLSDSRPDVVFNLIEGFGGHSGGEAHVTGLLELLDLPYTGCPPEAQALCHGKAATKALLLGSGLPTAPFVVLEPGDAVAKLPWAGPSIVKPEAEDASLGIDQGSVVSTPEALATRVARVRELYGPRVLVEAYLQGPELNVGLLALPEPEALAVAEVVYQMPPGAWPIVTYNSKWHEGSAEDLSALPRCPAVIDAAPAEQVSRLAVSAFRATGCRDYARVDIRLDSRGAPMILEVNPNPDLGPSAGWARALRASGRNYEATLIALARQALERGSRRVRVQIDRGKPAPITRP